LELKRKNINRGFTKLRVWEDSISLFKMVYKLTEGFPYHLSKSRSNILDASHSVSRNIAEGYCRKNIKEYLYFLNISLGSVGELYSGMMAFREIDLISIEPFEKFDKMHYKLENQLIGLIKSIQLKEKEGDWDNSFLEH